MKETWCSRGDIIAKFQHAPKRTEHSKICHWLLPRWILERELIPQESVSLKWGIWVQCTLLSISALLLFRDTSHFSSARHTPGPPSTTSAALASTDLKVPQSEAGYPMACRSSSLCTGMVSFPRKRLMMGRLLANLSLISISKTSVKSAKKEYFWNQKHAPRWLRRQMEHFIILSTESAIPETLMTSRVHITSFCQSCTHIKLRKFMILKTKV